MYQRLGPSATPKIIKWTLISTLIVTFFSIISNALFTQIFSLPSPQYLFSLTTWGIHKFFLWQFVSYLFIQPFTSVGITPIFQLLFNLYLLWSMGSAIIEARGQKHFIALFYGGGIFVGLLGYLSLLLLGQNTPLAGATPSIYMLLIAWVFLFPGARLSLFLFFPIQAKWLVFGMIGLNLFLDFSNGNFFYFFVTAGALLYAYFYAILVWDMLSPFYRLHPFEKKVIYLKRKFFHRIRERGTSKVYDFKTGKKAR